MIKNLKKEKWLQQLSNVITDPMQLLKYLHLEENSILRNGIQAKRLFPFRVPFTFIKRMTIGDPYDPLLLQVITKQDEYQFQHGFNPDIINEKQYIVLPGLLHKYTNRVLLIFNISCAIHCRYCFRRYFPYRENHNSKINWKQSLYYIKQHTEINEIILSGGDPLMAQDHEIDNIVNDLNDISHLKILRIHTRLVVIIPSRITVKLCQIFAKCRLKLVLVTHINHTREIDNNLCKKIKKLNKVQVTVLNQSVLLRGINDNVSTLVSLSENLFSIGILPYYLHLLDKVQGTSHFLVENEKARKIMQQLLEKLPGYLIPRLVKEIPGKKSKTPIDLLLE